jgi:uncharacterized membrane protein (Fun14 family)
MLSAFSLVFAPLRSKLFLLATLLAGGGAGSIIYQNMNGTGSAATSSASTWAFRIGISFVVAFLFAFLVKRAVKFALFVGATLVAGAYFLNKLGIGVTEQHMQSLEEGTKGAAGWLQLQADTMWAKVSQYLPSGVTAGFGLFRGARHAAPASEPEPQKPD